MNYWDAQFLLTLIHSSTAVVVHKKTASSSTRDDEHGESSTRTSAKTGGDALAGAPAALIDFNDPDLLDAMQIFANMSPEEMMETMEELKVMLGDDPETLSAVQQVMEQIPKWNAEESKIIKIDVPTEAIVQHMQSSLQDMIAQDEVAVATRYALKSLQQSSWDVVWKRREDLLEAVLASGNIDPEDAARFRTSAEEWEAELKFIWNELQIQTVAAAKDEL